MPIDSFPLISVLLLFITATLMPLIKKEKVSQVVTLASFVVSFIMFVITLNYVISRGGYYYRVGHFSSPIGIEFYVGVVECIMGILFTFVGIMILWYSIYNIHHDVSKDKINLYYLLVNILVGSLLGIVFSNDIFNVFVFIEIGNLASCGIVVIKDKKENIKAGIKYLIMSCLGSGLVLMGIAFLYSITGHLNMTYMHEVLVQNYMDYSKIVTIVLGLFTVGLGVKSAMFPLHTWLPDAHSNAPTSSSALLSSLVLKGYVWFLVKVIYRIFGKEIIVNFPILNVILLLGSLGMILGSVFAIYQKSIKRVIAYSTVAQMGYIFFAIGLGEQGLPIAIFHIIGHAVTKAALFLCAGSIIQSSGFKSLEELRGIGKEMPYTVGLFFIASLSMIGIPVLPGFVSKWYLALASIEANRIMLIGVILISSLLNAMYYFPIAINGFFGEENLMNKINKGKEKPFKQLLPIIVLVLAMIFIGVKSRDIINLIKSSLI